MCPPAAPQARRPLERDYGLIGPMDSSASHWAPDCKTPQDGRLTERADKQGAEDDLPHPPEAPSPFTHSTAPVRPIGKSSSSLFEFGHNRSDPGGCDILDRHRLRLWCPRLHADVCLFCHCSYNLLTALITHNVIKVNSYDLDLYNTLNNIYI